MRQGAPAGHSQETSHLHQWRVHQADHVPLLHWHLHIYQVIFSVSIFSCFGTQLCVVILNDEIGLVCDNGLLSVFTNITDILWSIVAQT